MSPLISDLLFHVEKSPNKLFFLGNHRNQEGENQLKGVIRQHLFGGKGYRGHSFGAVAKGRSTANPKFWAKRATNLPSVFSFWACKRDHFLSNSSDFEAESWGKLGVERLGNFVWLFRDGWKVTEDTGVNVTASESSETVLVT